MRGTLAVAAALLFYLPALRAQAPVIGDQRELVIRQLSFKGNSAIDNTTLAAAIVTTNSSWFARAFPFRSLGLGEKRFFSEEEFRRDVVRLEVLYRRSGFPNAQIDTTVRREPRDVYITFRIQEGEPIKVRSLEMLGVDSLPAWLQRVIQRDLPLQVGDPFNRYLMQASADTITHRLKDRGYPDARVFTAFESDRQALIAEVDLEALAGKRAVVGDVRVVGANRVEPSVVRNLLISRPGRRYSEDELVQSQRNLYDSDLFRYARVNIDSAAYQPGVDSVPLVVQVNEAKRRRIRGGLGFATEDCFRGSLGWTTRNFLGGNGRILDLTSRISKVGIASPFDWGLENNICSASQEDIGSQQLNYSLGATVRRPAFLSPNNTLEVSVYSEARSEFRVYLRRETGTSVTLNRRTPRRRFPMSLTYNLSYGRTEATDASFCASFNACTPDIVDFLRQNRTLATLTGKASLPRTNNPIDPSRGSIKSLEVTVSSRILGSSPFQQFTRIVGDASWYRQLSRDVVFSWRVRGGVIFSPEVDVGTQSGQLRPAGAAVLRRRPQRRARLQPERTGAAGLHRLDRGGRRLSRGELPRGQCDRRRDRRQLACAGQRRAPVSGSRLSVPPPARGVPGRGWHLAAGGPELRPGHPGHARGRHPSHHAPRPGAARRRLQSLQAPVRAAVPGGHPGCADSRARPGELRSGSE